MKIAGFPGRTVACKGQNAALLNLSELPTVFAPVLPEELIDRLAWDEHNRERVYPPPVVFWAFLSQTFNPEASCRETVRRIQAAWALTAETCDVSADNSGYCQARQRLPEAFLPAVHGHLAGIVSGDPAALNNRWCGRMVKVVDGSGLSFPDTPANQAQYPQSSQQLPGLGFPVLKLMTAFDLASGALERWCDGTLHDNESALFRRFWDGFEPGQVVLGDRLFCTYGNLAALGQRGVDCVFRVLGRRRQDFRYGKRLNADERLVTWHKANRTPEGMSPEQWASLPDTLTLRLVRVRVTIPAFRTQTLTLVTTLLDMECYSAQALADLYLRRWRCELFLRDLKITLHMDILRCKSPEMVRKEVWMHLIAYNLIRWLILQSGQRFPGRPLSQFSFKGTLDALRQWLPVLNRATGPRLFRRIFLQFLKLLAADLVPRRPHRSEPRARKRRPKNYHLLTRLRCRMGNLPHRNYPGPNWHRRR